MLRLVVPALAEEFLVLMVTWTDWWLTGHYFQATGDASKAAMGLMGYVMWVIPALFAAISIGATALVARHVGSNDFKTASRVANQAFVVGVSIALVMTVVFILFGPQFVHVMQLRDPQAAKYANEYLSIILFIVPLIMCNQVGAACLRGAGDTVTGFVAKLIVVMTNIVISAGLVTGWGPFPEVGWKGLAIGTATGHAIGGLIVLFVLIRGRAGLKLTRSQLPIDFSIIKRMFRIGLPGGFDSATLLLSQLLFLAIIYSLGKSSAAAHGLAIQIEAILYLPGVAFHVAAATLAGQFLGAGMPGRATSSSFLCFKAGCVVMSASGLILYVAGPYLTLFFTGDMHDPTSVTAAELLKIVAFAAPAVAVIMILSGALRGAGDTVWPLFFTTIGFFGLRLPLALYFCFESLDLPLVGEIEGLGRGVQGAWYAMTFDVLLRSLMVWGRFFGGKWRSVKV